VRDRADLSGARAIVQPGGLEFTGRPRSGTSARRGSPWRRCPRPGYRGWRSTRGRGPCGRCWRCTPRRGKNRFCRGTIARTAAAVARGPMPWFLGAATAPGRSRLTAQGSPDPDRRCA